MFVAIPFGILIAATALIVALSLGNLVIFVLLHDAPLFWLLRGRDRDVQVTRDVPYVTGSANPKQTLDLYRPLNAVNCPVAVFIHGGYWVAGNKTLYAPLTDLYGNVGVGLAKAGVTCAVINYRLAPTVTFEELLSDVVAAVRWTQETAASRGDDPNALFLMGHGSGGQLALLLAADAVRLAHAGVRPDALRGAIGLSPICDLADMDANNDAGFRARVTLPAFGDDPDALRRYSPTTHLKPGMPATLLLNASRDYSFLARQAGAFAQRLTDLHAEVTTAVVPNTSHSELILRFGRSGDKAVRHVLTFIKANA